MRAHIGVTIGNATSVAVCHTGDLADDTVFTSPSALYMSEDGVARLGEGDGTSADRFVAHMTDGAPMVLDDGASYYPEDLFAAAAYCLVETVSELYELTDRPYCTLTCPDAWDDDTRSSVADALITTGLPDATLVSDSEALQTWWDRSYYGPAAVVDVGVVGTRVSLMGTDARGDASFAVAYPGGDTFTGALIAHVVALVSDRGYGIDVHDRATMISLGDACESAKIALSYADSAVAHVRLPDVEADVPISRATFEALISREVRTVPDMVDDCLLAHGLTRDDIGSIVLVGGSATLAPLRSAFDDFQMPVVIEEYASARGAAMTHTGIDDSYIDGNDDPTDVFPVVAPPIGTLPSVAPSVSATPIAKRRRPSRRLTITAAAAMTFLAVGAASAAVTYSSRNAERNPTEQVFLPPVEITSAPAAASSTTTPPETTPSSTEPEPTLDSTTYVAPTRVRFTPSPTVVVPPPPIATTTVSVPTTTETTTTETTTTTTPPTTTTTTTTATTTTTTTTTTTKPAAGGQ